ncbi:hypothetical protein DFP72DRAFT_829593 [Ephemerocybe angulata]|uniref:Restriction of telomere capping protein 4 n=1 Tax=Ephemerocybe angulata TaxID=980116 RepID=A0A8H6HAZ6_9AGAR|nr:hypothetical protein DFP72DRAFT_829593 [Tulosesus angulatus]
MDLSFGSQGVPSAFQEGVHQETQSQDPVIQQLAYCTKPSCYQPMGPLRIYKGGKDGRNLHLKGALVQTCNQCHWTKYHTPAYVEEDALALLARINNPALGNSGRLRTTNALPGQSPNVSPVRNGMLAQTQPAPYPPTQPMLSSQGFCSNKASRCSRQANQLCLERLCKACCISAAFLARSAGVGRSQCKQHKTDASYPQPPLPSQAPVQSQSQGPMPSQAPTLSQSGSLPSSQAPTQTQEPRKLAQPMPRTWVAASRNAFNANTTLDQPSRKQIQQELNEAERKTVNIVVYHTPHKPPTSLDFTTNTYPKLQLKDLPGFMSAFGLTAESWIDAYQGPDVGWRTVNSEAVHTVTAGRPLLFRCRPSLTEGMSDEQCPELQKELARYPVRGSLKRSAQELVSPLKKSPKQSQEHTSPALPATPTPASRNHARPLTQLGPAIDIEDTDSELGTGTAEKRAARKERKKKETPTVPDGPTTCVDGVLINVFKPLQTSVKNNKARFPFDFSVTAAVNGLRELDRLKLLNLDKEDMFEHVFENTSFARTTAWQYNRYYQKPEHAALLEKYLDLGSKPEATFHNFIDETKGNENDELDSENDKFDSESENDEVQNNKPKNDKSENSESENDKSKDAESDQQIDDGTAEDAGAYVNGIPPNGLCPFCDDVLPDTLTPALKERLSDLVSKTNRAPAPYNPHHRQASMLLYMDFCAQHKFERDEVPKATKENWPTTIDFEGVPDRVRSFETELQEVMEALTESTFFETAASTFSTSNGGGGKSGALRELNVLGKQGAAYYGERGFYVIVETLRKMFPESEYDAEANKPLPWDSAVVEVLLPETAILLIMQDRNVSLDEAVRIHGESRVFGTLQHPIDDPEELAQSTPVSNSDAAILVDNPQLTPAALIVKQEPSEHLVPQSAEAMFIDLTIIKEEPLEGTLPSTSSSTAGPYEVIDLTDD